MPADVTAVVAVVLAAVALAVAVGAHVRFERLRRRLVVLQGGAGERPLIELLGDAARDVAGLRAGVERTRAEVDGARVELGRALRHIAVVRYDAFSAAGLGGHLSFSAALLDDRGDGIVLSSIAARSESRTYAKRITGGRADTELSPEERAAVDEALARRTAPPPAARTPAP